MIVTSLYEFLPEEKYYTRIILHINYTIILFWFWSSTMQIVELQFVHKWNYKQDNWKRCSKIWISNSFTRCVCSNWRRCRFRGRMLLFLSSDFNVNIVNKTFEQHVIPNRNIFNKTVKRRTRKLFSKRF